MTRMRQRLVVAAQAGMNLLLETVREFSDRTTIARGQPLAPQVSAWARQPGADDIDPAIALRAIFIWSQLHGFVSLEIAGNFASMGIDPDQLFELQLTAWTV
jgi:hypothetical protein